jgi:hypothetical protein
MEKQETTLLSNTYDFQLVNCDTDSLTICKKNHELFSEEEQETLLKELNSLYPKTISWEDDGYFKRVIVVKAKNYILHDPLAEKEKDRLKIKGSAIKATTKAIALKEFINKVIHFLIHSEGICREAQIKSLYHGLVLEILDIKDMTRWSMRKTVSEKVMNGSRANETKVRDAIEDTDYDQGDRVRMFYLPDSTLELEENFKGIYNRKRLLKNLFDTAKLFAPVLPNWKELCPNYSLVKKMKELYTFYGIQEEVNEELDESA